MLAGGLWLRAVRRRIRSPGPSGQRIPHPSAGDRADVIVPGPDLSD